MKVSVEFAGESAVVLRDAVLLYGHQGSQGTMGNRWRLATLHEIRHLDGTAEIMPGRALDGHLLRRLATGLLDTGTRKASYVPAHIVFSGAGGFAWWVPPGRRQVWVRGKDFGDRSADVPHPGLVFGWSYRKPSQWSVWAVAGKARPTTHSAVFQAPYLNVYASGAICAGNVSLPRTAGFGDTGRLEDAFFRSYFTHSNTPDLVRYKGGSTAFWLNMLDGRFKRFPERVLVPREAKLERAVLRVVS